MGGKSSSSSHSEQVSTTNQTDRRIGATDAAVVIAPESNSPINIDTTDPALLQFAHGEVARAADFAEGAFDSALAHIKASSDKIIEFAREGEGHLTAKQVVMWGGAALVAYGVIKKWG